MGVGLTGRMVADDVLGGRMVAVGGVASVGVALRDDASDGIGCDGCGWLMARSRMMVGWRHGCGR